MVLMVGKPGCSGGRRRRAGAGRKPGTTAIKKNGKATTKKKKSVDPYPRSASVNFLGAFVVKKKAAAAEPAAAESLRSPRSNPGLTDGRMCGAQLPSHHLPTLTSASVPPVRCAQS